MKVDFIRSDDWEGLYIDGKCVAQGHLLDVEEVLSFLNVECTFRWLDSGYMMSLGWLPTDLKDIAEEGFE